MIVQVIPRYSAKPVKLEIVNGRMKIATGMTINRLLKPQQFFFRTPFVNTRTRPAVKNAKVLSKNILDKNRLNQLTFSSLRIFCRENCDHNGFVVRNLTVCF